MSFQASNEKEYQFLELLDNDNNLLEPTYSKGGSWLKYFGHSNLLYIKATRAIVNHTAIGEYQLRFFPQEEFKCLCSNYSIKTRWPILFDCTRYNEYWNLRRNIISYFTLFLEFNSRVFLFGESIT